MKKHYIFSKEGAMISLGLNTPESLNYYIKKAKKLGVNVSKKIGGIEYYDIDSLVHPENHLYDGMGGQQLSFKF